MSIYEEKLRGAFLHASFLIPRNLPHNENFLVRSLNIDGVILFFFFFFVKFVSRPKDNPF